MSVECSTCHCPFNDDEEGIVGEFGLIPVAFCGTCLVGVRELAEIQWDLVPRED